MLSFAFISSVCGSYKSIVGKHMVESRRPTTFADNQLLYLTAITLGDQSVYPSLSSPFTLPQEALDRQALLDAAVDSLPAVKGY